MTSVDVMNRALTLKCALPAFNIPYLHMMEPIIAAVQDEESVAMIAVARVEWMKFKSKGIKPVYQEFTRLSNGRHTLLHLDHVPVIDEDDQQVDFREIISRAIDLGYKSIMVDGSRLPFEENVKATALITELSHARGIPVEAELGKVLGHESGPSLSYEEILRTRTGFTDPDETRRFIDLTECDWLSVACGNIHGAVSELLKDREKPAGQLDIEHISRLFAAAGIPLVLHGGSGVTADVLRRAIQAGITKVNVGTDLRQVYERAVKNSSIEQAQLEVYSRTREMIAEYFNNQGLYKKIYHHGE